jgi:hypothetical protein
VKAIDAAKNKSAAAVASWTVDATAPAKPLLSGAPSGFTSKRTTSVTISAETGASVTCSVDGGSFAACTSPKVLSDLADGEHSLAVRAQDAAGNTSGESKASWTVDTLAPSVELSGAPVGITTANTAKITYVTEQAATVTCSVDGGTYEACSSPIELADLADGEHSVAVKAEDAAGNMVLVVTDKWTVNTATPSAPTLAGAPDAVTSSTSAEIAFSGEDGAVFKCSVDGGAYTLCSSPKSLSGLSQGKHTLAVMQVNAAGTESDPAIASWHVDSSVPSGPVVTGVPTAPTDQTRLSATISAASGSDLFCSIDGAAFTACQSTVTRSGLLPGPHTLAVKAVSQAGVVSPVTTKSWTILGPIVAPALVKTPVEVYKKNNRWYFRTGATFSSGGDARSGAGLLTVQISEATAKPSDTLAPPTTAAFADGVVAWAASG